MADFTTVSSKRGDVEMANGNEHYHAVGSIFSLVIFKNFDLLQTFLTSRNDFSQNENKGYLADPGESAGNKPGWKGNQNEEGFDPWALPELQDLGPKWSGKFRCVQCGCILRLTSLYHKIPKIILAGIKWFKK